MGKFLLISIAGTLALSLSACSDMKHMLQTSDNINDKSEHLAKRTDDLERELVNKESNVTLNNFLEELFGDGQYGKQDLTEPKLLEAAGVAVEAMHFQYWKGDYNEPLAVLDDFFAQSLEMVFVHSSGHIPRDLNPNVLQPGRDWKAVGALSFHLSRMRPEYAANLAKAGLKDLSAYDVIVQALKNRDRFVRKEKLPKTTALVLQWKQEAIYMLQMRQIFTPVAVLARLTNFQDQKDLSLFFWNSRAWDALVGHSLKIDLSTNDPTRGIDPEQLKLYTLWLNQALQTRQDLRDMCIEPQSSTMMNMIMSKVDIVLPSSSALTLSPMSPQVRAQNEFLTAYKKVISPDTTRGLAAGCAR